MIKTDVHPIFGEEVMAGRRSPNFFVFLTKFVIYPNKPKKRRKKNNA
jgi:hypothetical protein